MAPDLPSKLAELRKELLDLTRRNRLLHLPDQGRAVLPIVDEKPDPIWRLLVEGEKTLHFLAAEEAPPPTAAIVPAGPAAGGLGLDLPPLAQGETPEPRHHDARLQTALESTRLQERLLHLAREARSALEELGTNLLYLTFGTVEWVDAETRRTSRAPLLFVPVELERRSVQSRHTVHAVQEDLFVNPNLLELARRIHGVALPEGDLEAEGFVPTEYFAKVEAALQGLPGWRVHAELHLGLFSFAKLLLYRDLDPEAWPAQDALEAHRGVASLLGADAPRPAPPHAPVEPGSPTARGSYLVVDADASQHRAILAARAGDDLVIEGPPGTGKSQTITNLIAEFLAQGRTVLFVAEKAAALDVVHARLQAAGLGEFLLELHSRHASKRSVLEELQRTLEQPRDDGGTDGDPALVDESAARLQAYVDALHAPHEPLGRTPYEILGTALALAGAPELPVPIPDLPEWTGAELRSVLEAVHALDRSLAAVGAPERHPWRGAGLTQAGVALQQELPGLAARVEGELRALAEAARALGSALGTQPPESLAALRTMVAEPPAAPPPEAPLPEEVRAVLSVAVDRRLVRERIAPLAEPGIAHAIAWLPILERRRRDAGSLLRWCRPSWYRDGKTLARHLRPGTRLRAAQDVEVLTDLVRLRDLDTQVAEACARLGRGLQDAAAQWCAALQGTVQAWFGGDLAATPFAALQARMAEPRNAEGLQDWADHVRARRALETPRTAALLALATGAAGAPARGRLAAAYERQFHRLLLDHLGTLRPALGGFRGLDHDRLVERFRAADRAWLTANRARVAARARERRPALGGSADRESRLGLLRAELRKKRRHMPLRRLFADCGEVIQALKPCFLMSPLSVAHFLAPEGLRFDVVIFDEASQVEPADALGAIARARQMVLIGDEKQLPPTRFFAKQGDAGAADGADPDVDRTERDVESILSLGVARLPGHCRHTLRWHYRSRHESLIGFSNTAFYDGALRVFPSPQVGNGPLGLAFRFVTGGVYERGGTQQNPVEAQAVAEAVLEHARQHPELSLGVGAFSLAQQRAIEDRLEALRRAARDPRLEEFFAQKGAEPFFVKNLETIQGDEREVIFLSVGYGRDAQGRMAMNFGPLNQDGGWRRLNVLVTRARRRCEVFASIHAHDLDASASTARGVTALREYLRVAEHGRTPADAAPAGPPSPVEADLAEALRGLGHTVHARVGPRDFAVDLAIVDPRQPGRYLLGIEADGAVYRNCGGVRDRDRLREEVLRRLGWDVARVWSAEWYRRREGVLKELAARIDAAARAVLATAQAPATAPAPVAPQPEPSAGAADDAAPPAPDPAPRPDPAAQEQAPAAQGPGAGLVPYPAREARTFAATASLASVPPGVLGQALTALVEHEGPIHVEEATRVLASWFGTRAAKTARAAFERGLRAALAAGRIEQRGEFLWRTGQQEVAIRWRGGGCPVTEAELIPPEELAAAVLLVLRREFGLRATAIANHVARTLGYARTGPRLAAAVDAAVAALRAAGRVREDGPGFLVAV
ncbi:MAG: DUF4011 domain-containing protein [Planctomycetes bacterium]|nr:DUF4011 domain-containing protein [Planctomycetota bacterium]